VSHGPDKWSFAPNISGLDLRAGQLTLADLLPITLGAAPVTAMDVPLDELAGLHALVVDDELDVCELLTEHLGARRILVTTARDGRAAVTALERSTGRFGLILTDVNMPGADGFTVLRAAREANPATHVVMITGYASLDTAIEAVRLGAQDYLTKPFSLGQIDVALHRLAEDRRRARQSRQTADRGQIEARLESIERSLMRIELALIPRSRPV
jgi:DNA-binding NtrC family response regulator